MSIITPDNEYTRSFVKEQENSRRATSLKRDLGVEKYRSTILLERIKKLSTYVKSVMLFEVCKNFQTDVERVKNRIERFFK